MDFISAGVLVPIVTLFENPQRTVEQNQYSGELETERIRETVPLADWLFLHPLTILGVLFVVHSLFAMLDITIGVRHRMKKIVVINLQ